MDSSGPLGGNATLIAKEAKPLSKIAIFLAQPTSENASANTMLLEQPETRRKLLISLVALAYPGQMLAKKLVTLRGSSPK